jgi:cell division septation protein DedD
VPELTHDTAEDGFHEIQLSGKQLVFVGMTGVIVFVAIFLCGVLVGRNTRPPRDGEVAESAAVTQPATTAPDAAGPTSTEPPAPPAEDPLTYHERLQGKPKTEELKPKPEPQAPPAAAKPAVPPPAPAADVPTTGRPGTWFVQVFALQNRAQAEAQVKRLRAKGHPAYLELPARGAVQTYRVRVGRYNDRREAEQVARRLKEDQLTAEVRR